jgi:c(7)-type cytochrome triheme protein
MRWRRYLQTGLVVILFLAAGLGSGCSTETRHRILTVVFEGVPPPGQEKPPGPYIRKPRRPPPYKPPPPPMLAVKEYKPAFQIDWKALLRKLPKDAAGGVDWVKALADGDIHPASSIDPDHPNDQPVLPLDVHLDPPAQPLFKVVFPHEPHTQWLACTNCHPKIFHMQAGADPITMNKIFAGEYCGRCHGKVAFDVATGCPRCHRALAGPQ